MFNKVFLLLIFASRLHTQEQEGRDFVQDNLQSSPITDETFVQDNLQYSPIIDESFVEGIFLPIPEDDQILQQAGDEIQFEIFPIFSDDPNIQDDAIFPGMGSIFQLLDFDNLNMQAGMENNNDQIPVMILQPFSIMDFFDFLPSIDAMMYSPQSSVIEVIEVRTNPDGSTKTTVTKNLRKEGQPTVTTRQVINQENPDYQLSNDFKIEQVIDDEENQTIQFDESEVNLVELSDSMEIDLNQRVDENQNIMKQEQEDKKNNLIAKQNNYPMKYIYGFVFFGLLALSVLGFKLTKGKNSTFKEHRQ